MTIYDLHIALMDKVDKLFGSSTPEISIEQRDRILNVGIEVFIKQRYGGDAVKGKSFEEIQKRSDDLANVVEYKKLVFVTDGAIQFTNVRSSDYSIPNDYWFAIIEQVKITYTDCGKSKTDYTSVKARRHNEIDTIIDDEFNTPLKDEGIFRVRANGVMSLFHDRNVTISEYTLGYIKKFSQISNDVTYQTTNTVAADYWQTLEFWMPNHTHTEIVNLAAQYALELIESPRLQTFSGVEITTQE